MMRRLTTLLLLMPLAGFAQVNPPPFDPQGHPNRNQPGPWDNDVLVYRVAPDDRVARLATFERAGVPTAARLSDGRLIAAHQHFPADNDADFDKVAVRFSSDEGRTWTAPQVVRLTGLPQGMRFPFDPTLVPLPDGRVRLYFTSLKGRRFEEHVPAIYSAISTNGVDYTFEPGVRFGIEGRPVIDCAVVLHDGLFHLYAPDNGAGRPAGQGGARPRDGAGYHATSRDGLNFTRTDDVQIEGRGRWLGNAQSTGTVITFFGTGDPGIWMATSSDGQAWTMKARLSREVQGADPGAVRLRDGSWLVIATGPPRPGTPSARGQRRRGPEPGESEPGPSPRPFSADGPWNHRILLATSRDGLTWQVPKTVLAERASVPELFALPDGRAVIVFAVDHTVAHEGNALVQTADGKWQRRHLNLPGADPNVVRLADGSYRAYTKHPGRIEVHRSTNGLDWTLVGTAFSDRRFPHATDPDVFETKDGWVMLLSLGPQLLRCTSADGLTFQAGEGLNLGGSVCDTVAVQGGWRTYFHVNANPRTGERMHIRSAFTTDGRTWKVEEGVRVAPPATGPARFGVADPAPLELPDGTWLMAIKSFIESPRDLQRTRSHRS